MSIKVKNCCPSCSGYPDKQFTLDKVKHYHCGHCGYIAPSQCFDSLRENDEHRLQYDSKIVADSGDQSKKAIIESLKDELEHWEVK